MPMVPSSTSDFDSLLFAQIRSINPRGLILDMDDTLYWESSFVSEFARHMMKKVLSEKGPQQADQFFAFFTQNWARGNRREIFQQSVLEFNLETITASDFFESMRTLVVPDGLTLRTWAKRVLVELETPIAVLTNGDQVTQQNKFAQLWPKKLLRDVELFCAKDYEPKPSGLGALAILKKWKLLPADVLLIGDSPLDMQCAMDAGCDFLFSTGPEQDASDS
jgi:phosphoglycolate phosphatase-like HAD superfamily hydrolase